MVFYFKSQKKFLIILFFVSLVARALFFYLFTSRNENYNNPDSPAYHGVAVQLVLGNGISSTETKPNFYRLPGYPIFLSLFYKVFDFDIKKTLWAQIFISCFIPILVFFLSLSLFPDKVLLAKIASFYTAIHLGFIFFSGLLITESLFTLFFLVFLILFYKNKNIILAGIFLGLASYFRPVGQYIVFLSIFLLMFFNMPIKRKIRNCFLLLLSWFVIVSPWLLRNFIMTGYLFFHTLPGGRFLNHSAAYVVMHKYNLGYAQARDRLSYDLTRLIDKQKVILGRDLNDIELCKQAEGLSFGYLKQEPVLFIKHSITNILKTIFMPFGEEILFINNKSLLHVKQKLEQYLHPKISSVWLLALMYLELIFMLLVLIGFLGFVLKSIMLRNFIILLKTLSFITLFIVLTLAAGFARLRLPIEPLIYILSFNWWLRVFKF